MGHHEVLFPPTEQQARAEMESLKAEVARGHQKALESKLKDVERAWRENEWQLKEKMEMDRRAAHEEHQRVLDEKLKVQYSPNPAAVPS